MGLKIENQIKTYYGEDLDTLKAILSENWIIKK